MALGKVLGGTRGDMFVSSETIRSSSNVFYEAFNTMLNQADFDAYVHKVCKPFQADGIGRPGLPPGVYFRILMVAYLEGISSERDLAWRINDSIALRTFLG